MWANSIQGSYSQQRLKQRTELLYCYNWSKMTAMLKRLGAWLGSITIAYLQKSRLSTNWPSSQELTPLLNQKSASFSSKSFLLFSSLVNKSSFSTYLFISPRQSCASRQLRAFTPLSLAKLFMSGLLVQFSSLRIFSCIFRAQITFSYLVRIGCF